MATLRTTSATGLALDFGEKVGRHFQERDFDRAVMLAWACVASPTQDDLSDSMSPLFFAVYVEEEDAGKWGRVHHTMRRMVQKWYADYPEFADPLIRYFIDTCADF